ncbi:unnamed protein product [Ilex paraguariensis]|uniref:SHSP domain-containing protein n=1 Tax=Ilex paraguariensis TaxID=185542 RepID=A0ABC8TUW4_9AQUA
MDLALRDVGFDASMIAAIHDMLDFATDDTGFERDQRPYQPSRAYVRDNKAMRNTPADVVEYTNAYHFIVDMPGVKGDQIKVQVEDNTLVVSGERRREKEHKDGASFISMERRHGKLMKKFVLPEDANKDAISAFYQDGVLTVVVEKLPPPEAKKPKTIEVKIGSHLPQGQETPGQEGRTGSDEAQAQEAQTLGQEVRTG